MTDASQGNPDPHFESHQRFTHRALQRSFVLNSVPKCGTMALRNVLSMFVPWDQIHWPFQGTPELMSNWSSESITAPPRFFTMHVEHTPQTAATLRNVRVLTLVRDPRRYVLAHATFLYSTAMRDGGDVDAKFFQDAPVAFADAVALVIGGFARSDGNRFPGVRALFQGHALHWLAAGSTCVRYEELLDAASKLDTPASEAYFAALLTAIGVDLPSDWRERVRAGIDRRFSATARENLTLQTKETPARELTPEQLGLLDFEAPGLREALGYGVASAVAPSVTASLGALGRAVHERLRLQLVTRKG